ncbi:MAG: hypothetical protein IJ644_10235 [Oscillospiraceae bacterium]|nr:hypothetical protein [Oscillospiraceae bacterium]
MTLIKFLFLTAFIGHLLCWRCDWIITYTPKGRFQIKDIQDNHRMAELFDGMPLKNPLISMLLGVVALTMIFFGYLGLYEWMKQFSAVYAGIIIASAIAYLISGTAHHVFCGAVEWFYINLGRTEKARQIILEFFKKTSATMYIYLIGMLIFSVAFLIAVITGQTNLPQWSCIFNVLPLFLILSPFRIVGAGNLAGAVMFLGLSFLV